MNKQLHSKWGWWLLFVAIVGDFAVPFVLAIFYDGYSHMKEVMSALGNPSSPVRWFYNIWLVALGVLLIISCVSIYRKYSLVSKRISRAVIMLIYCFAVGAGILAGLFSVNESRDTVTTASLIHGIGSALGFMAMLFVPLLIAIMSFKSHDRSCGIACLISFLLSLGCFVLFIMAEKNLIASEGLWERLTLLFMYVPLGYIATQNVFFK